MKCAMCDSDFNDGVQCSSCKNHLDFGCANITETGWRKLGLDRRAVWRCSSCKVRSPVPSISLSEPVSLQTVFEEIRDVKRQMSVLTTLVDDVRSLKVECAELKASCDFNGNKLEEIDKKISGFESRISSLEQLRGVVSTLQSEVVNIQDELSSNDQRSRLNNVEIKGVPLKKDEDLFKIVETIGQKVGYAFPRSQINYITRVPQFNSKEKSIILSFLNRYVKEDFVAAARSSKTLSAQDIGYASSTLRVFVNDHLNADSKQLLNKTRQLAKEYNYKYTFMGQTR